MDLDRNATKKRRSSSSECQTSSRKAPNDLSATAPASLRRRRSHAPEEPGAAAAPSLSAAASGGGASGSESTRAVEAAALLPPQHPQGQLQQPGQSMAQQPPQHHAVPNEPEQQAGPSVPPAELDPEQRMAAALKTLTQLLGAGEGEGGGSRRYFAEHALRAVLEQNPELGTGDPLRWVEEAQVWVACNNEQEAEIVDLRQAMAASLAEAEALRSLKQKQPERNLVLEPFRETRLMQQLEHVACPSLLSASLSEEQLGALVKLLELETKCCKRWYPSQGTRHFFQKLAAEVAAELGGRVTAAAAASASPHTPSPAIATEPTAKRHKGGSQAEAAAAKQGKGKVGAKDGAAGTSPAAGAGSNLKSNGPTAGAPSSGQPLLRCKASDSCHRCGNGGGDDRRAPEAKPGASVAAAAAVPEALGAVWTWLGSALKSKEAQVHQGLAELPPKSVHLLAFTPAIFRLPDGVPPDEEAAGHWRGDSDGCVVID